MDQDTLKQALEHADLTRYEAEAYLTLVDYGRLAAVDVAKKSAVPTSQVYDTLRSLEDKGFVETIEQDRLHAEPCDPVDVLAHLRERGNLLTDAAEELEDRWEEPDLDDHRVGVVKQPETVIEHVRSQLQETSVAVEVALTADQFEALAADLATAAERGVVVHAAVYYEEGIEARCTEWDLPETNVEIRTITIPGPFLAVLDRSRTYFTPNSRAGESYGILINDDILSFINHWYFQTCLWFLWEPLHTSDDSWKTYVSLKEFIREVTPLFRDGADVGVTVEGIDVESGEYRTVTGTVSGIFYPNVHLEDEDPSLEKLSTYSTIQLTVGDEDLSVGGWGTVFEDIEAQKIRLETIAIDDEPVQS